MIKDHLFTTEILYGTDVIAIHAIVKKDSKSKTSRKVKYELRMNGISIECKLRINKLEEKILKKRTLNYPPNQFTSFMKYLFLELQDGTDNDLYSDDIDLFMLNKNHALSIDD